MPLNRVTQDAWSFYNQSKAALRFGDIVGIGGTGTSATGLIIDSPATANSDGLVVRSLTSKGGTNYAIRVLTTDAAGPTTNQRFVVYDSGVLEASVAILNNAAANTSQPLSVTNNLASTIVSSFRAAPSQTSDIIQWQNSAGSVLGAIASSGTVVFGGNTVLNSSFGFTLFNKIGASYYTVNDSSYFSAISFARGNSTGSWMSIGSTGDSANGISNIAIQNGSSNTVFSVSQTGATTLPRLNFSGGSTTISALTLADGTVSFEGTAGQLFSISNSLTGTIFSINDISGLPSVEVTDLGIVKLNELYGQTVIGSGTPVTSAQLSAIARTSATIPLVVRGVSGQSVNLQEWQNNTPTTVASISNTGAITAVDLTLSGNLTVNGTTTNINTVNLVVEDKNIILGDVTSPSTTTADGGGITLLAGGSNKTFNWINSTDRWTSSVGLEGTSIVRTGGTSSQFLKADGSIDSSSYLTTGTASSTYLPLAGGTLTGTLIAPAATTSLAPIRIPHGTAPTTPTNGDIWTTTSGLFVRVNGATVGPLAAGFSNPMTTLGDIIYGGASGTPTRLAGSTSSSVAILSQLGNGTNSAAPTWRGTTGYGGSVVLSNDPDLGTNGIGGLRALGLSGTLISTAPNSTSVNGGQIYLNGATGNRIDFNSNGLAAPSTTTVSVGTKITIYPNVTPSTVDYAIGAESTAMWLSVANTSAVGFKFYGGTTNIATLSGAGALTLSSSITTGGALNLNYASPTIASNNASAASIFTSTVTGVTIGSSTIKTTAFPADGTTSTASASSGYMGMPQVQVTSGGRTLAATDAGKHIYMTTTSGQTLTIPANSTVAFPVGTTIVVVNANTISTSIAITTDTLRLANSASTGTRTLASNGMCTLLKIANTEWIASGNGLT